MAGQIQYKPVGLPAGANSFAQRRKYDQIRKKCPPVSANLISRLDPLILSVPKAFSKKLKLQQPGSKQKAEEQRQFCGTSEKIIKAGALLALNAFVQFPCQGNGKQRQ